MRVWNYVTLLGLSEADVNGNQILVYSILKANHKISHKIQER